MLPGSSPAPQVRIAESEWDLGPTSILLVVVLSLRSEKASHALPGAMIRNGFYSLQPIIPEYA
jgi:hypothetical protein